jgi:riboflavin synthase
MEIALFTGLISEIGCVRSVSNSGDMLRIAVTAAHTAAEVAIGDSVNINGACQTVVEAAGSSFSVDTIKETISKTTLGYLKGGERVNLEQAVRASDRLGGHIVSGHVDCVEFVRHIHRDSTSIVYRISLSGSFRELIVPQGSVAVNGISLTVAHLTDEDFTVAIIPTTWSMTTLPDLRIGDGVNIEFDIIGKYILRFLSSRKPGSRIDEQTLRQLGF